MKYSLKIFTPIVCIFFIGFPKECQSSGIGIYFLSLGNGSSDIQWSRGGESADYQADYKYLGYGIVFDSRVASPGIFSYRLSLGYANADFVYNTIYKFDFSNYSMSNIFCFTIFQSKHIRLWLDPQFELMYMKCREDYSDGNGKVDLYRIGLSPVLGVNFNIGSLISVCPEIGYRFSYLEGQSIRHWNVNIDSYKIDWEVNTNECFFRLNMLLRFNDLFY
jgi:hypothetical protein